MKGHAGSIHRLLRFTAVGLFLLLPFLLPPDSARGDEPVHVTVDTIPNVHLADASQYVSDPNSLLPDEDTAAINNMAATLDRTLGVELAVVVLKSVGQNDARMFATDLFNHWGLGKKGKDTGLLILLVTEPPQRSVIFETGYGLEGVLPDAISYRLQQRYMIPDLSQGNYGAGLVKGVAAVRDYLAANDEDRALMAAPAENNGEEGTPLEAVFFILGFFLLLFVFRRNPAALWLILGSIFSGRGGRGGWGGGGGGSWGGGASGGGGSMSRF